MRLTLPVALQLYCCCCDCVSGPDGCSSYLCCCKVGSGHTGFEKGGGDLAMCVPGQSFGTRAAMPLTSFPCPGTCIYVACNTSPWVCFLQEHGAGVQLLRCASPLFTSRSPFHLLCVARSGTRCQAMSQICFDPALYSHLLHAPCGLEGARLCVR